MTATQIKSRTQEIATYIKHRTRAATKKKSKQRNTMGQKLQTSVNKTHNVSISKLHINQKKKIYKPTIQKTSTTKI